jgi:hypothetical protein
MTPKGESEKKQIPALLTAGPHAYALCVGMRNVPHLRCSAS